MSGVLKMRLATSEVHVARIRDFSGLQEKRTQDLQELQEILSRVESRLRTVKGNVQEDQYLVVDLSRALDWEMPERFEQLEEDLRITLAELTELEDQVRVALATVGRGIYRRKAIDESPLWTMAEESIKEVLKRIEEGLGDVRQRVYDLDRRADGPDQAAAWEDAWDHYYAAVEDPRRALIRDYVDFLHGIATRDVSLDEDICELADQLIIDWGSQVSLTIPAMLEALETTVTRIVRLGFRDWSIWALPVVAREVGCVVNSKETPSVQLADFLAGQGAAGHAEDDLRDYLADVYASCVMGPAYGFAAIYLQFNPCASDQPTDDHPPDAYRAEVILSALAWMSRREPGDPFRGIIETLRTEWRAVLEQAGRATELEPAVAAQLQGWAFELAEIVRTTNQVAMFTRLAWEEANRLKDDFLQWNGADLADYGAPLPTVGGRSAVLNAAWLALYQDPDRAREIAEITKGSLEELSRGGRSRSPRALGARRAAGTTVQHPRRSTAPEGRQAPPQYPRRGIS